MADTLRIYAHCDPEYEDIKYLWGKVRDHFIEEFVKFLEKNGFSDKEDPPFFIGEFISPNHWQIETLVKRVYAKGEYVSEKEEIITKIEGVLLCSYKTKTIKPSIPFLFTQEPNGTTGKLEFSDEIIKQVMSERLARKKELCVDFDLSKNTLTIANELSETSKNQKLNDAKSALKNLNFSNNEINLMVKSVVSNQDISGLSVENLVGELLRYR